MIKSFLNSTGFFPLAVALFFLTRGLLLLTVFPPLEGWDEYQHLAYIQHLVEQHSVPVFGEATVSPKLLARVNSLPQPWNMRVQLPALETQGYVDFFSSPKSIRAPFDDPKESLYQAQHGNLYYALMAPLFLLSGGIEQTVRTISVLRLVNLSVATLAIFGFGVFALSAFKSRMDAYLVTLIAACHPLILVNVCRVANDALAFALGMPVIIWALRREVHKKTWLAVLIGALLGLAIWAKATNFFLFPFIFLNLAVCVYLNALSFKRAVVDGFVVFVTALLVASQNLYFNWLHSLLS